MRALLFALSLLALPTAAQQRIEVDVELVLAVDVSRSMTFAELEIQRQGYAQALTHGAVMQAIRRGMIGRIALTYVEWAGHTNQRVIVPWTLIEGPEDAEWAAGMILASPLANHRRTSIASALLWSADAIEANEFDGLRRVIDVSGDGPNNQGPVVTTARDAVLARGIIINGIPLMTRDGLSMSFGVEDLDAYYRACVIGGPGAFVIPVTDWTEFAEAVQRKLVLEIAGGPVRQWQAQARRDAPAYDCLIGEKLWERNRRIFDDP
jgi:hypothetical protein